MRVRSSCGILHKEEEARVAHLALALLGSFQAKMDGQPAEGLTSDRLRALLAYLAVANGREHTREEIADVNIGHLLEVTHHRIQVKVLERGIGRIKHRLKPRISIECAHVGSVIPC